MRRVHATTFVSNLVEFQAFTSAITLLLALLGPQHSTTDPAVSKERQEDLQLVETVTQILEGLKRCGTGVQVVNQSVSVIRTLQGVLRGEPQSSGKLRLSIPHFGFIIVASGENVRSVEGERILGANPRSDAVSTEGHRLRQDHLSSSNLGGTSAGQTHGSMFAPRSHEYHSSSRTEEASNSTGAWHPNTILQFTSSQYPTFEAQGSESTEWPFDGTDTMFYDSLLNTDVGGNWDLFPVHANGVGPGLENLGSVEM